MAAEFWDSKTEVGQVEVSEKQRFAVYLAKKDGKEFCYVEKQYRTERNPAWQFSKGCGYPAEATQKIAFEMLRAVGYEIDDREGED